MGPGWREEPFSGELLSELSQLAAEGAARSGLAGMFEPADAMSAVAARIETRRPLAGDELTDEALALGCFWGDQLRRSLGWSWVILASESDELHALVSPDRRFAVLPMQYIHGILRDRETDNTVSLLFDMLLAGRLPEAEPGSYHILS